MNQYWVSCIIQEKTDKRAWLCSMSDCALSMDEAMETINKARKNFTVLSAWIDTYDENNVKNTVYHECYINALGDVQKD